MQIKYDYLVGYYSADGKKKYHHTQQPSEAAARQAVVEYGYASSASKIINVTNISASTFIYKLASGIIAAGKKHPNAVIRVAALFSKPIASVIAVMLDECQHLVKGDPTDDASTAANRVIGHLFPPKK